MSISTIMSGFEVPNFNVEPMFYDEAMWQEDGYMDAEAGNPPASDDMFYVIGYASVIKSNPYIGLLIIELAEKDLPKERYHYWKWYLNIVANSVDENPFI